MFYINRQGHFQLSILEEITVASPLENVELGGLKSSSS